MRKLIILIVFFFTIINAQAQNNFIEFGINKSLTSFILKLKEYQEKQGKAASKYFDDLYLSIDNYPPRYPFTDSIADMPMKYISLMNNSKYDKLLKKGIWVVFLHDLNLSGNKLTITYTLKNVSLIKKELFIGLSDSSTYTFEYSCDNNEWKLVDEK